MWKSPRWWGRGQTSRPEGCTRVGDSGGSFNLKLQAPCFYHFLSPHCSKLPVPQDSTDMEDDYCGRHLGSTWGLNLESKDLSSDLVWLLRDDNDRVKGTFQTSVCLSVTSLPGNPQCHTFNNVISISRLC